MMDSLLCDKQFLLLWFKNYIEIERNAEDEKEKQASSEAVNVVPFRPMNNQSYEGVLNNGRVDAHENIHNMAIVEDPRFEGTICDSSDSLGLRSQIVRNNTGDFSFFTRNARQPDDQSSNYEIQTNSNKRSASPMFEGLFTSRNKVNNLTYEDILDLNFLQNFLELIDKKEFFLDEDMTQENLINHIIYMMKQFLRKRNFDPSRLLDGLKNQLLHEELNPDTSKSNKLKNSFLSFHHGFESEEERNQKGSFIDFTGTSYKATYSGFHFDEPKWFLIKLVFLIAFLNKDKTSEDIGDNHNANHASKIFTSGFDFHNQMKIKPSFLISSMSILNEVLSKLQFYDDSSIYQSKDEMGTASFYTSNPRAMEKIIGSHQYSAFN
jgi:hypothetical protein